MIPRAACSGECPEGVMVQLVRLEEQGRATHDKVVESAKWLEALNHRTRKSEVAIAVLQWAMGLTGAVAIIALGLVLQKVWP